MPRSHQDRARKAFERITKTLLPASHKALARALDAEARSYEHERFDFLGFTFRPRSAPARNGGLFVSFCPAISDAAAKAIRHTIRRWRLHLQSGATLADLAKRSTRSCEAG